MTMKVYEEIGGKHRTVDEDDALQFAKEEIENDEELKKEYEAMLVEWFFSGNWIEREEKIK